MVVEQWLAKGARKLAKIKQSSQKADKMDSAHSSHDLSVVGISRGCDTLSCSVVAASKAAKHVTVHINCLINMQLHSLPFAPSQAH